MHRRLYVTTLLALSAGVHANTITVTSNSGLNDNAAACVLRDAITAANTDSAHGACAAGSGSDTIVLPAGATITLSEVDAGAFGASFYRGNAVPPIGTTITIQGNGAVIERDASLACDLTDAGLPEEFRLMQVLPGATLTLTNVTLRNGCANGGGGSSLDSGGAIYDAGTVNLVNSLVTANQARSSGAILVDVGATLAMTSSAMTLNFAGSAGGAVYSYGTLTVDRSLLAGNTGNKFGGGAIYVSGGTARVTNSTISGNTGAGSGAGGIDNGATLELTSATLVGNTAVTGPGGVHTYATGSTKLKNVLLSGNGNGAGNSNCQLFAGTTTLLGTNLSSDGTCTGFTLQNANVMLGSLKPNGGRTRSFMPSLASPAVDATTDCTAADGVTPVLVDQRGHGRGYTVGGGATPHCDAGAVEADTTIFTDAFDPTY